MSLKAFHFFFIIISVLLSAFFAGWCFNNYEELNNPLIYVFGVGSIGAMVGLAGYLIWFLKKSRNFSFLAVSALVATTLSQNAQACATCFGNSNHPMVRAANEGVWFLMIVISGLLVAFAGLFIFWGVRARKYEEKLAA